MEAFLTLQFFAPLLVALFSLAMGFAVLRVEKRNVTYQYYFTIMLWVAVWSVFVAVFHVPGVVHDAWTLLHWAAGMFIAPAYLLFLINFPVTSHVVKTPLRIFIWLGAGAMAAATLLWPQNFVQYYIVNVNEIPHLSVGPYAWLLELYFPLYFIPGFFFAGKKFLQAYGRARAHIATGLFGLALATTGALFTNVTLALHFGKEFIWLGPLFAAMAPASLAYMLFGLREGKPRLFPSFALGSVVLAALGWRTVTSASVEGFIFNGIILVGVLLLTLFLVRTSLLEEADLRRFQNLSRRLQRFNIELQKADRVKSEFLAIVSHHLRTPLTHIKWALTELSQGSYGGKLTPQQQKLTTELLANNERLVSFIESFMDTSRIETGKLVLQKEKANVEQLVRQAARVFAEQAKYYRVDIEIVPSQQELHTVSLDREAMQRVLENILENALMYNRPGGKVYIQTEAARGKLAIRITDTGIGILKEDIARVGEKFFRSPAAKKQVAEGTGLGMFIARHIVRLHGGKLRFESQEGEGTTVTIELPYQ